MLKIALCANETKCTAISRKSHIIFLADLSMYVGS